MQTLRERVNRVREWLSVALSGGRFIVSTNLETLGCAFSEYVAGLNENVYDSFFLIDEFAQEL